MTAHGAIAGNIKLTTAKLYIQKAGDDFIDVGNILKYKHEAERKLSSQHESSRPGYTVVDDEKVVQVGDKYTFTLDEHFSETRQLLFSGTAGTHTQASVAAPSATASITGAKVGRSRWLGFYDVSSVVVKVSNTTKTLNTDYTLDAQTGMLFFLPTGTIVDGDTVAVTFGHPSKTMQEYTTFETPTVPVTFKLVEMDQESGAPFQEVSGTGKLWISADGDEDGEKYNEFELTLRIISQPAIVAPVR